MGLPSWLLRGDDSGRGAYGFYPLFTNHYPLLLCHNAKNYPPAPGEGVRVMTLRRCSVVLALTALSVAAIPAAPAQTLTILHNFTGGTDGGQPQTGMTQDQHGNFYGTTQYGGIQNCDNG